MGQLDDDLDRWIWEGCPGPEEPPGPTPNPVGPDSLGQCPEINCPGTITRRWSPRFERYFYGCTEWSSIGCKAGVGCHPDGSPLGTVATEALKAHRRAAHEVFDKLWNLDHMSRGRAYALLEADTGIRHIAECDEADCKRVIEWAKDELAVWDIEYVGWRDD